ncbi:MAG TPA: 50S ribosomal protein L16 [Candidatus Brocadiia bacterium]|nr:50S ribosomal protein L16 [Candidatus Brocadiia bacterium]
MALMPRRVKYRKHQRGHVKGTAQKGNTVCFGDFGLQALEPAWISAKHIEAARMACTHYLRREGKLTIRIFPHKSVSAKPAETRMGKGKGEPEFWCAVVKPGTVMFEVAGVPKDSAKAAFSRMASKLPIKSRFIERKQTV